MTKTICDICGKEMPTTNDRGYNFCISSYGRFWDICNDCRQELNKWIKNRKECIDGTCGTNKAF